MLRVISQATAFQKVDAAKLLPSKQYCAICGSKVNGIAYIDNRSGNGIGVTLCENDAYDAMQSPSQPLPQEQQQQQQQQQPNEQEPIMQESI